MGIKKFTGADVARLSGVSAATVSYVLNGRTDQRISPQTRKRILEAAQRVGYRPNRLAVSLSTGRTHHLGLITPPYGLTDGQTTYSQGLFLELSLASSQVGMNAVVFMDDLTLEIENKETGLQPAHLLDGRVDGVIIFGDYFHSEWIRTVSRSGLPCVEIGSVFGDVSVQSDGRGGLRVATEHLLSLGHRRMVYWTPPGTSPSINARLEGYREALRAWNVSEETSPVIFDGTENSLRLLMREARRPTGIVTFNDAMAAQAMDIVRENGLRIPEDVSIVGFDNDLRAVTVRPKLTTVANPIREMARVAVAELVSQVEGHKSAPHITTVPTTLVVRDSTAQASQQQTS